MSNHYHDPEYLKAREELTEAVKRYSHATNKTNHVVLGATVVFETSIFDSEGFQEYATSHVILDPGSLIHAVGLLETARDRIVGYINREDD